MPIVIRNQAITPPSFTHFSDDEEDFIRDPEQVRDQLPQPYRMIDKVMNQILDEIWDQIADRETSRMADAMKVRPPKYQCAVQMQMHGESTCLCDSKDGRYIFAGVTSGLVAIDAATSQTICVWEEDDVEISQLDVVIIGVQMYLISTVDDMGIARLFAFANDRIYLLKVLNEQEGGSKLIASKCQSSTEGDYVGVVLENPLNNEKWLEVHRNPRDNWLRELESIQSQILKDLASKQSSTPIQEDTESQRDTAEAETIDAEPTNNNNQSPAPSPKPTASPVQNGDKTVHKFSPPTMLMKLKPPGGVVPCSLTNPAASSKLIDTGDVIGTGVNHQISNSHLDQRKAVFDHLNESLLKMLPKGDQVEIIQPTFHFLAGNRMLPLGLEQPAHAERPLSIAVWWTGATHLLHYSLVKPSKDADRKPDLVWPFSQPITSTTVSSCTTLLAVGLANGIVVVWDIYMGLVRKIVKVSEEKIQQLKFLNPNVCPQQNNSNSPYPSKSNCYIMVMADNSSVSLLHCGMGDNSPPSLFLSPATSQDTAITRLEPLTGIPEIILCAQRDGVILLKDIVKGHNLCQVVLPDTHALTAPWQPIIAMGGDGLMLYIKGTQKDPNEDYVPNSGAESLFVFQLRSFPTLDRYWRRKREEVPYLVHNTVNQRVDAILKHRLQNHPERRNRLQRRWSELKEELQKIQEIKEANRLRLNMESGFNSSSITKTTFKSQSGRRSNSHRDNSRRAKDDEIQRLLTGQL